MRHGIAAFSPAALIGFRACLATREMSAFRAQSWLQYYALIISQRILISELASHVR
jgi:hypothetical protein